MASIITTLRRNNRHNWATLRSSPVAEIAGSLGDLGTLLPLMIAMAVQGSIDLGSTLVFSGAFNIIAGIIYGIPLPVQPMKAIASAAISIPADKPLPVVMAAGQLVGAAVLLLSITGLLRWAVAVVPTPVVKGIQLGAGLSLIVGAGSSLLQPLKWTHPILDNRLWALLAFVVLVLTQRMPRFAYALYFFLLGLLLAGIRTVEHGHALPWLSIWSPHTVLPSWLGDGAALSMAIGQLPLTTLNSVIAVCALAADLLPERPTPSVTSVGISVALMNLTGTWFGAMPVCHGAGGLAGQHRFGARSGASVILLGIAKVVLGLFFGKTLVGLLSFYPGSILGIMVLAAGLELAKVGHSLNQGARDLWQESAAGAERQHRVLSDTERQERWTVMLTTTAGILAFKNDAVGFAAGMLCHWALAVSHKVSERGGLFARVSERTPLLG